MNNDYVYIYVLLKILRLVEDINNQLLFMISL